MSNLQCIVITASTVGKNFMINSVKCKSIATIGSYYKKGTLAYIL